MIHLTGNTEGLIIPKMKDKIKIHESQSVTYDPVGQPVGGRHTTLLGQAAARVLVVVHTALGVWLWQQWLLLLLFLFWLNIKFTILTI